MASLLGAKTALSARGTPGLVTWRNVSGNTPRPAGGPYTRLMPGGLPGRHYGSFEREESLLAEITASDIANLSATEEPFDRNEIATTDTARLSASEVSQLFNFQAATDTASFSVSETISLVITGVTAKVATDTASLSASEAVAIAVTTAVTDTASASATDSGTVDVSTEQISLTDTASIATDEAVLLNVFTGVNVINVADTALVAANESGVVREVRRIKRIALLIAMPRIELEIL